MLSTVLFAIAGVGLVASTVFLGLVIAGAVRWHRRGIRGQKSEVEHRNWPGVTLLKPVHGMEPRLRENLESFFRQDYPQYEIIFGARDENDAAIRLAREIAAEHPTIPVTLVFSGIPQFPNAKIFSLSRMVEHARFEHLIISDSDVEVAPNYISDVIAPLLDDTVGCVTCLYRGLPAGGIWSRLEALGMSTEMSSGVLVADMLEGMKFALGPTMATRKDALAAIGGFAAMRAHCSDDYILGNWIAERAGYEVVLSHHVIDHIVMNKSFRDSMLHQIRWMKSSKHTRPKGHFGTGLTFAVPFGLLGLVAGAFSAQWALGIAMFATAYLNRVVQSILVGWGVTRDARSLRHASLYPLRDLMGFFFWMISYSGNVVEWRGERYRLEEQGRMVRVD